ncbi:alpha/beta hydrolase [Williamsia deligens]|uniref:Alpha/beta hydrolase n=1 Tax=Williamsia deligens TaxID=321325 RepID=A0ABW3G6A7_9NOCA|nr:alpha/beta hydrolase [Williamsia deligens]MCP2193443.1 Acetyl esterase/lipase [Williamsia deligens]
MKLGLADLIDPRLIPLSRDSQHFYAGRTPGRGPAGLAELRDVRGAATRQAVASPPGLVEMAQAGGRSVPIRVHHPETRPATGVVLEMHGGGFSMGSAADGAVRNQQLADGAGVAVVSVDYRLAPEHPWPAAPDDCETAALWLCDNAEARFGTTRLTVLGFSAGATLATTTMLRLRDRAMASISGAVLQFGTYDLSGQTPAGRLITDEYFISAYAADTPDRTHPDLSPIFADLTGLPAVLMIVGDRDILLNDNLAMAARLSAQGVDVDLRVYPDAPHGFTHHPTPLARAALGDINSWLIGES